MEREMETRTEKLQFRVSPNELLEVDEKAYHSKLSRSDYLRKVVLSKETVIHNIPGFDHLVKRINQIHMETNRIMRRLEQCGKAYPEDLEYVRDSMDVIYRCVQKVHQAVEDESDSQKIWRI